MQFVWTRLWPPSGNPINSQLARTHVDFEPACENHPLCLEHETLHQQWSEAWSSAVQNDNIEWSSWSWRDLASSPGSKMQTLRWIHGVVARTNGYSRDIHGYSLKHWRTPGCWCLPSLVHTTIKNFVASEVSSMTSMTRSFGETNGPSTRFCNRCGNIQLRKTWAVAKALSASADKILWILMNSTATGSRVHSSAGLLFVSVWVRENHTWSADQIISNLLFKAFESLSSHNQQPALASMSSWLAKIKQELPLLSVGEWINWIDSVPCRKVGFHGQSCCTISWLTPTLLTYIHERMKQVALHMASWMIANFQKELPRRSKDQLRLQVETALAKSESSSLSVSSGQRRNCHLDLFICNIM